MSWAPVATATSYKVVARTQSASESEIVVGITSGASMNICAESASSGAGSANRKLAEAEAYVFAVHALNTVRVHASHTMLASVCV